MPSVYYAQRKKKGMGKWQKKAIVTNSELITKRAGVFLDTGIQIKTPYNI